MSKENMLRITLFVSVLAFNPVLAQRLETTTKNLQRQQEKTEISADIANILHKRGLDEDVAHRLSQDLTTDDEETFAHMMENLLNGCKNINKNELLTYLSNEALFRKSVDLKRYDQLVSMVSKIKQKTLDANTLKELQKVAIENRALLA